MIRRFFMAKKMSKREQYAIFAAGCVICAFAFFQIVLFPAFDNRTRLKRTLEVKSKLLVEMRRLRSEYEAVTQSTERLKLRYARRPKAFSLFAFLDRLAGKTGVKDHIAYMKPSSAVQKNSPFKISMVEMKLQAINLKQLTNYLYGVETSDNMVNIKRASFVKKGKGAIDAVLQVETVTL